MNTSDIKVVKLSYGNLSETTLKIPSTDGSFNVTRETLEAIVRLNGYSSGYMWFVDTNQSAFVNVCLKEDFVDRFLLYLDDGSINWIFADTILDLADVIQKLKQLYNLTQSEREPDFTKKGVFVG